MDAGCPRTGAGVKGLRCAVGEWGVWNGAGKVGVWSPHRAAEDIDKNEAGVEWVGDVS